MATISERATILEIEVYRAALRAVKENKTPLSEKAQKQGDGKVPSKRAEHLRHPDLSEAVHKAVARFIGLGFHKAVYPDISEEEARGRYRKDFTLRQGASMPEDYQERFPVINVVEPRIPISEKASLAGIERINACIVTNETQISDKPYVAFTHDGYRYFRHKVDEAISEFTGDEVGEPLTETIDLYLNHPRILKYHGRDSIGSRIMNDGIPSVDTFRGHPKIEASSSDDPSPYYGAGSRGKKIIELGF